MGQVRKDSVLNTIITYTGIVLGYINKGLLFPFLLLPEQVGLANVLPLIVGYFGQLSNFGANMILHRFIPFFRNSGKGFSGILVYTSALLLIGIAVISGVLFLFSDTIFPYFSERSSMLVSYAPWILPLGVSVAFFSMFDYYLRAIEKNLFSIFLNDFVLRVLVFVSLCLYYFKFYDFESFIVIFFSLHILPCLFLIFYMIKIKRFYISTKYFKISRKMQKLMFNYGIVVYFNGLGRTIILMTDMIMLSAISGLKEVGICTTMVFFSNALYAPYTALMRISSPYVSKFWKSRDMKALSDLYRKVSAVGFFITFSFFTVVWFNIDLVLSILPDDYATGKYIFLFFMMGRLCDSIGGLNGDILLYSKKYKMELWTTVPMIGLILYLNYVLITLYDGLGAAIVFAIVFFLFNLIRLSFVYYFYRLHPFDTNFFKILTLAAVMFISCFALVSITDGFLQIGISLIVPLVLFILPVYKLRWISDLSDYIDDVFRKIGILKT